MNNKVINQFYGFIFLLSVLGLSNNSYAQNASDLRLNEILVHNESNFVDNFGNRSSWIEIFNSAYSPINIGGCYLTDDVHNPTKYWIPTGSPLTMIPPRSYLVFWADNNPTHGIFHLSFKLDNAKELVLFDGSGRTVIDKIEIVQPQKPDISYGKKSPDSAELIFFNQPTPGSDNNPHMQELAGESFSKMDPFGLGMTLIAMIVVFSALAILYLVYNSLGKYFVRKTSGKRKHKEAGSTVTTTDVEEVISGELNAAVAMTLYLYQTEMHDYENTVLTIQKVSRNYSPWNSKIYNLRKMPK